MHHHELTLAGFAEAVRQRDDVLALILTGSVARGAERPDSDVDVYLVVTDAALDAATEVGAISYVHRDLATYDGGYVDVKLASPTYLEAAAERADEPTRASLLGARIVFSRIDRLDALLTAITTLPDIEWERRVESFVAQQRLFARYFLPQSEKLDDPYLRAWASTHFVNAASRALLARNRVLFAGPKYLRASVAALADLPAGVADALDVVLAQPTSENAATALAAVEAVLRPTLPSDATLSRFVDDAELAWLRGTPPPEAY